jgi:hypothetical protein
MAKLRPYHDIYLRLLLPLHKCASYIMDLDNKDSIQFILNPFVIKLIVLFY